MTEDKSMTPSEHWKVLENPRQLIIPDGPRLISYEFPLRPNLTVNLWFPDDMTEADAERVAAFVRALAIRPTPASPERTI
jgi:hypothetical protein